MKQIQIKEVKIGDTFFKVNDNKQIIQYEKISNKTSVEILTNDVHTFEEDVLVIVE